MNPVTMKNITGGANLFSPEQRKSTCNSEKTALCNDSYLPATALT
jgi:hypothetical protein